MKRALLFLSALLIVLIVWNQFGSRLQPTGRESQIVSKPSEEKIISPRTTRANDVPVLSQAVTPMEKEAGKTNLLNTVMAKKPKATRVLPAPAGPPVKPGKEPLQDPLARVALSMVGYDSEAEEYWFAAINDPEVPAEERSDLIEDLNEEGFPDPKNISAEDLPLIVNRLALIEAVGPEAMDKVNADAFQEAYKDLANMLRRATGQ